MGRLAMMKENIRQSLQTLFDERQIVVDPTELITYEVDAGLNRGAPDGVVFPQSTEAVARLVAWAAEQRVPLVARSAGTGLSGGAVPSHGGIVVSFTRMSQVLELDKVDRIVEVQPGLINLALDGLVKSQGLYYPPDPASQKASSIGGNIAENAGGPHCFKYGVTTNYVDDLTVVLANGQVAHTGGRARDYPTYDFTGLLTGSEGTLGMITQATLRLIRNAPGVKTLTATFDSVEAAGQAVSAIIAAGLVPAALEMMDRNIIGIIEDYVHAGLPTDAAALLLVEVDGYPASLEAQIEELVEVLNRQQARRLHICKTAAERDQIWLARKSAFGAMARLSPAYFQVDGTVPRSRLSETLAAIKQLCQKRDLKVAFVFHAGDGNLHPLIPFDPGDAEMIKRVYEVGDEFLALAVSKDGAITGEHGVGIEKRKFMPLMYSPDELAVMREVKEVFDPDGIFNPGKIFPDTTPALRSSPTAAPVTGRAVPSALVPQNEEEAADGLRAAQAAGRQVILRGGGRQSAPAPSNAIVLSTEKLRGVVTFAPEDLYVTVQSGTRLDDLQAMLSSHKLWVPIGTPWKESTIGGIISTGLNSPQRMRYGGVRDQVLGLRAVLPDGRRVRFGRPVVKNVAGYDMVKLFVGAHGTLGLITEVTFRLTALPRARRSLCVPLQNPAEGLQWAGQLLPKAFVASAVVVSKGDDTSAPYLLTYTAEGYPQDVDAELEMARTTLASLGVKVLTETDTRSGFDRWASLLRKEQSHLRIGVPPKSLPDLLLKSALDLGDQYVADLASGLVWAAAVKPQRVTSLRQVARAHGGYAVITAARADAGFDPWGYAPDTLPLMRRLKARWDPKAYLNSGVFVV
jgi:D-lactate dehydrogenase (cytochrome)